MISNRNGSSFVRVFVRFDQAPIFSGSLPRHRECYLRM
jgi:hypothetical protein